MATIGDRASTWTNLDGLVVGYGPNKAAKTGSLGKSVVGPAGLKTASVVFSYVDLNANAAINVPIAAGSRVVEVKVVVHTTFVGASNTLIVGDGNDTAGFITTTAGAVANLTGGAVIASDGVYVYDNSVDGDTTAREFKLYSSADTIDVDSADADWTAGVASLVVTYI